MPPRGSGATAAGDNRRVNPPTPLAAPVWRHPEFERGARDMLGIALGIAAWGLITGVAMVKSGLPMPLALLMSLIVFAGSAQLAVLPLLAGGAPLWVVWATAICVNLRFVIFSAQWRPYFVAPAALRRRAAHGLLHRRPELRALHAPLPAAASRRPSRCRTSGAAWLTNWVSWQVPSLIGIVLADASAGALGPGLRRHAGAAGA